jgi:limonene-1,2-epoxide hydrolase
MTTITRSPSETVHFFLAAMAKMDFTTGLSFIADDCEYHNMPMGKVYGPAGVRAVLEPFFAPTTENEFVILREMVHGPAVFMERLDRHKVKDTWVELPVAGIWEVHNGRITLWREYFDAATITNAMAALNVAGSGAA